MADIVPPTERECERCGRTEVWDDERSTWIVEDPDSEANRGRAHCLHEWDINGAFNPLSE